MPNELFQGEDKTISVSTNIDLSSATEIDFRIDTPTQIIKKLSSGVSGVTSTLFLVAIDAADTETVPAGNYKYQVRATLSTGKLVNGKFSPNKIIIKDSIFTTAGTGRDYN